MEYLEQIIQSAASRKASGTHEHDDHDEDKFPNADKKSSS
jgi:hypothetical protein